VRAGREDPGDVLGGRPLRADARGQEQRLRTGQVQFGLDVDWRDYGADRADLSGCQRVVQFADFPQQPFIDLAAGVVAGGLDCAAFWVGGTGDDQQAAAALVGTGDEGIRRREPEIGVDSDGTGPSSIIAAALAQDIDGGKSLLEHADVIPLGYPVIECVT
jgi:hypothetical protein